VLLFTGGKYKEEEEDDDIVRLTSLKQDKKIN
jgi:hypothetical protein